MVAPFTPTCHWCVVGVGYLSWRVSWLMPTLCSLLWGMSVITGQWTSKPFSHLTVMCSSHSSAGALNWSSWSGKRKPVSNLLKRCGHYFIFCCITIQQCFHSLLTSSLSPFLLSHQAFLSREVELEKCVGELRARLEQADVDYRKKEWSHADTLQEKQLHCQRWVLI